MKLIIKISSLILIICSLLAIIFLSIKGYEEFIAYLVNKIGAVAELDIVKSFITVKVFWWIRISFGLLAVSGALLFLFSTMVHQHFNVWLDDLREVSKRFRHYKLNCKLAFFVLLVLTFGIRLYYAMSIPVNYDEAWTFLHFTSKSFFSSMAFYPVPNNHVLHSILTNLTYYLPFGESINLRLPSMLLSTLSVALLFYVIKRIYQSDILAFSVSIIFSALNGVLHYGFLARGYSLVLFAFIIAFYALIKLINEDRDEGKYYRYLALGNLIGLYTMPSFVYATFSMFVILFVAQIRDVKLLFKTLISALKIVVISAILYTPIIILSGFDSLLSSQFAVKIPLHKLLSNIPSNFEYLNQNLLGFSMWISLGLIVISMALLSLSRKRVNLAVSLSFFVLFPIIVLLQGIDVVYRLWIFLLVPFVFLLVELSSRIPTYKVIRKTFIPLSLLISVFVIVQFNNNIYKYNYTAINSYQLSQDIQELEAKHLYINHPLVKINLKFHFLESDYQFNLVQSKQANVAKDTLLISNSFDALILENVLEIEGYKLEKTYHNTLHLYVVEE